MRFKTILSVTIGESWFLLWHHLRKSVLLKFVGLGWRWTVILGIFSRVYCNGRFKGDWIDGHTQLLKFFRCWTILCFERVEKLVWIVLIIVNRILTLFSLIYLSIKFELLNRLSLSAKTKLYYCGTCRKDGILLNLSECLLRWILFQLCLQVCHHFVYIVCFINLFKNTSLLFKSFSQWGHLNWRVTTIQSLFNRVTNNFRKLKYLHMCLWIYLFLAE
jgi:hypothetical protein